MKPGRLILAALVLSTLSSMSYAKDYTFTFEMDFYAGHSQSYMGYQISGAESADLEAIFIQGGVTLWDWVSLEARFGKGMADGDAYFKSANVNLGIELDSYYGLYAKVGCPHSGPFYLYGILGKSNMKTTVTIEGSGEVKESETGTSYGLGLDFSLAGLNSVPTWLGLPKFKLPEDLLVSAEYLQFLNSDSVKAGGLNLGVKYRF